VSPAPATVPGTLEDEFGYPGLFPNAEQMLVLEAALAPREQALAAYAAWRRTLDIAAEFSPEIFRLVPLLYDRLRQLGVDDDLTGRLKGAYRMAWVKSHRLADQARPIVQRLADSGLKLMSIKGAPLGLRYYGNPALRPMADYDLVVPAGQVAEARRVLGELGYSSWMRLDQDTIRFRHAMVFVGPDGREFDLHWHVSYDLCDDGADRWFWNGAEPFELFDRSLWAPDATRMLFHTILHGLRWNEEPPIRWIPDAMMILRSAEIDWRALIGFAEQRAVSRRLLLGLRFLRERFAAPIPGDVIQRLALRPASVVERLENRTALQSTAEACAGRLGSFWIEIVPYTRYAHGKGVLSFCSGLAAYLRFQWGLPRRRDIPAYLARRLLARLGRSRLGRAAHAS
jgi:hypothetical protein